MGMNMIKMYYMKFSRININIVKITKTIFKEVSSLCTIFITL